MLISVHGVLGALAALVSADQPAVSSAVFIALVLCQSTLLGMWGGLGHSHWVIRLLIVFVGTFFLYAEFGLGIGELQWEIYLLVAIPTFLVGLVCWAIRLAMAIQRVDPHAEGTEMEGLQFSIRHLMELTLVVACLMTIGKLLAPLASGIDMMAQLSALGVCYAAVALSSMWAVLGLGSPAIRSCFVILIAIAAGVAGGYVINGGREIVFWASTTMLQAAMQVASLLVIRSIGYRVVAKSTVEAAIPLLDPVRKQRR